MASRGAEVRRGRGERTCTNLSSAPLPISTQQFWVGELLVLVNIEIPLTLQINYAQDLEH
ncbi:hypothetical protein [Nostoc sp. C057]|uniref:hypothetical protein n=1 Tax=Nostoc sp. C057 TaxID=2576903 RepID=UPI001C4CDC8C|nr:hypothetical protein [Nostoc sp. C057]